VISDFGVRAVNCADDTRLGGVKLSLDYRLQQIVEQAADKLTKGAIVMVDVTNGDVVATASRPQFSQNQPSKSMGGTHSELVNRAFQPYNIGSIFKIVVAATALENNTVNLFDPFKCTGKITVDGRDFACHNAEGHGDIDFQKAFTQSCNPVFIDVALKTGYQAIYDKAKALGFGNAIPLGENVGEQSGNLPPPHFSTPQSVANFAIGQGDFLATPIQVADLMTCIANGGERKKLNLLDSVLDASGETEKTLKTFKNLRVIEQRVAEKIKQMLTETVTSGTGKNAQIAEFGNAAGKTGSAETGWIGEDGKTMVQAWFAGYFPVKQPKYALVVMVENGGKGGTAAAPIFQAIAKDTMTITE
ncbi:MAG: penicillin-binding protein 2, partial [Hyphomonadaceae bacterium]|nr:penicillin-binding protein 2 [Clostridia bacterium]